MVMEEPLISGEELTSPLFLHVMLNIEIYRAREYGTGFSLVTIGIKDFENLSPDIQSELLEDAAEQLEESCQSTDLIFYEDGYFDILRPGKSKSDSRQFAERISEALNRKVWLAPELENFKLSLSVVSFPEDGNSKAELVHSWTAATQRKEPAN
jgi:GGDEF domain-containing protein